MAAADFFAECDFGIHGKTQFTNPTHEQRLEDQAKHIDAMTLLLQAYIRGFFSRQRHLFNTEVRYGAHDKHDTNTTSPQTGEDILEHNQNSVPDLPGLQVSNNNFSRKASQLANRWKTERGHAIGDLNFRPSTKSPDLITPTPGEFEHSLEQVANHPNHAMMAPWWTEIPLDHKSDNLCTVCSHIKFDTLLHTTTPYMYEPPIPLGNLQYISRKIECAFCRLLTHSAAILLRTSIESLRLDPAACSVFCHLCGDPDWARCATRCRQICLRLTLSLPDKTVKTLTFGRIQQILRRGEHPPEQKFNDVRRVKNQIDLDLIKSWIQICEVEHCSMQLLSNAIYPSFLPTEPLDIHSPMALATESCQPTKLNRTSFLLTVIDVKEECLIDVLPEVRYVALSYVWGGPQTFQNVSKTRQSLYRRHSISLNDNAIPATIRDAICLVALLGERYLWVDSLCICQDDMDGKMRQIDNMGTIYSQAMLTIVAAHGRSAQAGLPGVQPLSRITIQHTEVVQNILLANEISHLDETLLQSYWDTRGWTYQEKELSRRCLIFGENQVYFRCNRNEFKEDSGLRDVARGHSRAFRIRGEKHPIWNSYCRAVEGFTKRSFSFETDLLNAFQGVASLFQPAFQGELLFGLPETELDAALLWQPASSIHRRIDKTTGLPLFPSWSWGGWVGEIRYKWSKHLLDDQSRVDWKYTDGLNGHIGFCTSDELRIPKSGTHSKWEYVIPSTAGTPYYYQPERPNIWCLHPTARKEERQGRILLQHGYHFLTFQAYVAKFCISAPHKDFILDPIASCTSDAHILCPGRIVDDDGFAAGTIYLPGHVSTIVPNQKYEFVCLSRRRSDIEPDRSVNNVQNCLPPTPEAEFKETQSHATIYPVGEPLVIARTTFDPRRYNMHKPWPLYNVMLIRREKDVAYRVAIGLIHVTAFLQAQPVKKLITLG